MRPLSIAALVAVLAIASSSAQDAAGHIEGTVVDAVSHQPVKKAAVSVILVGGGFAVANLTGVPPHADGSHSVVTDATGAFTFSDLTPGKYQLTVLEQNYPQTFRGGIRKTIDVSATDSPSLTIELMPGATISGRIVDEDGDPMSGCFVQPHPAKNLNRGVPMQRAPLTQEDGSYRMAGVPAGKYIISAQCSTPVFQPRPLSAGPDPPPTTAYPLQYYSAASDAKSAQVVELGAGGEKSGVNFQMRPVSVTEIHGTFAGGVDLHSHGELHVQLLPIDTMGPRAFGRIGSAQMNADGSFDIRSVFPGSYQIMAISQPNSPGVSHDDSVIIGGVLRVDVADKPLNISLQLHQAMDITGRVQMEGDNNTPLPPGQVNIQLQPIEQFGPGTAVAQPTSDGAFTLKSVLPAEYRIRVFAPRAFLKSARMGGEDVTNRPLNLSSGAAGPLDLVISTNTGTIQGTAPVGERVFAEALIDGEPLEGWRGTPVDSTGHFKMDGLAPGKYRVVAGEEGGIMPDGGQDVTVIEGETATIEVKNNVKGDVKAEDKP
ncbi:MAG TPA: carboxypeptidase regulatory-like domain-containing protein [Bryobacteraceae bacterium]|nr:carboxypeptidase regulatory-like domain-containing protein [Bryobacteraceae bacterium]